MDQGFFVAAFGIDGELEGTGKWPMADLSAKWVGLCEDYLQFHGATFDEPWSEGLAHIRTKFTSVPGAALVTFRAHGIPVASIALASGESPSAESSLLGMFVESLRGTDLVRVATPSGAAFNAIEDLDVRPLMVVVPWAHPDTSDQDQALVRELSLHLAGAYFLQHGGTSQPG